MVHSLPLTLCEVTGELVLDAAHIKANHAISNAGAFVAALAQAENAVVLTGDSEFESPEKIVRVEWLK